MKTILKKIPVIKRFYPSIIKKIYKIMNIENINYNYFNVLFCLNINEPIDKEILFFDNYENSQINFLIKNIEKKNFNYFIDVGANSGLYSLIIAKKFENLEIKSFEPIESTFLKLKKNLSLNPTIKNIEIFNFGLSNNEANLLMKAYKKNDYIQKGGYGVATKNEDLSKLHTEYASFKKADDILNLLNKHLIIKIDVEGHEKKVLDGMNKIISNNKVLIQIEIFDWNFRIIDTFLREKKFKMINSINDDNKIDYFYINY